MSLFPTMQEKYESEKFKSHQLEKELALYKRRLKVVSMENEMLISTLRTTHLMNDYLLSFGILEDPQDQEKFRNQNKHIEKMINE